MILVSFCLIPLKKYVCLCVYRGEGNGTPLQYFCLENPMDGGAWKAAVHGVTEGRTRLSDSTFPFHFHALEKEMAAHSSVLAWRIPGMGEPGGLPSMQSHSQTRLKRLSSSSMCLSRYNWHKFTLVSDVECNNFVLVHIVKWSSQSVQLISITICYSLALILNIR